MRAGDQEERELEFFNNFKIQNKIFSLISNNFKILFNSTSNSNSNKMTETHHLCDLWEHTIAEVFKHDPKSILGLMLKEWVIFNKLENFNSILNYTIDDFTPSGI